MADVGVSFSKFAAYLFPALSETLILADLGFIRVSVAQIISSVLILFLTAINTLGVKEGKFIQTLFTLVELIALFGLLISGFMAAFKTAWDANWSTGFSFGRMDGNTLHPYTGNAALGAIARQWWVVCLAAIVGTMSLL